MRAPYLHSLTAFALAALAASSVACSSEVELTGSTADAIIIHAPPHPNPLTPIQIACGADVIHGGCVHSIAFDVNGALPGTSVTVTGYFEKGSVVTVGGMNATVTSDVWGTNPTHVVFQLPSLPAGIQVIAITASGSPVLNEIDGGPLVVNVLAPYLVDIEPDEIPAGTSGTIALIGHGLFTGESYTVGHETGSLTDCFLRPDGATQCAASAPLMDPGTYPVFINTCPSIGLCYSQSLPFTYALSCQDRYVTRTDGSVYDLNSGKIFSYKGQDTQQYCGAYYGCPSASVDELKRFFGAAHPCFAQALSVFPLDKIWSSSATRTGEDTYTAIAFDPTTLTSASENGDDKHTCICVE